MVGNLFDRCASRRHLVDVVFAILFRHTYLSQYVFVADIAYYKVERIVQFRSFRIIYPIAEICRHYAIVFMDEKPFKEHIVGSAFLHHIPVCIHHVRAHQHSVLVIPVEHYFGISIGCGERQRNIALYLYAFLNHTSHNPVCPMTFIIEIIDAFRQAEHRLFSVHKEYPLKTVAIVSTQICRDIVCIFCGYVASHHIHVFGRNTMFLLR